MIDLRNETQRKCLIILTELIYIVDDKIDLLSQDLISSNIANPLAETKCNLSVVYVVPKKVSFYVLWICTSKKERTTLSMGSLDRNCKGVFLYVEFRTSNVDKRMCDYSSNRRMQINIPSSLRR